MHITDPFYTTRKTREVGLGLALFAQAARRCEGDLQVDSGVGEGTVVTAFFSYSHIDRPPMGDIKGTLISLIALNPGIDFMYKHIYGGKKTFYWTPGRLKENYRESKLTRMKFLAG